MKIDKTRFLLLTSTIAASATAVAMATTGCTTTTTKTDAGGGETPTIDSGTSDASDASTNSDADATVACLGDNGAEAYCGPTGEGGDEDAGADGGDGGLVTPACPTECSIAKDNFKKEVANAINACLNKETDAAACDSRAKPCAEEAIAKACPDTTSTTYCQGLVAKCGDSGAAAFTQQQCEALANALSESGRTKFTFCLTEGGDTCIADPAECINQAKQ